MQDGHGGIERRWDGGEEVTHQVSTQLFQEGGLCRRDHIGKQKCHTLLGMSHDMRHVIWYEAHHEE